MTVRTDVDSILTVNTPADSYDLTDLTTTKDELGVTVDTYDTRLARWITAASQTAANYTNRVFPIETVTEVWRFPMWRRPSPWTPATEFLTLRRYPVVSIVSVIEDANPALTAGTDFECDPASGQLWRLDALGNRIHWNTQTVTVNYSGGMALDDPRMADISLAVQLLVKVRYMEQGVDPNLRQESIPGVIERQWWVPGPKQSAIPLEVQDLLDPYCEIFV